MNPKSPERLAVIAAIAALDGKEATYADLSALTGLECDYIRRALYRTGIPTRLRRRNGRIRPVINPTTEASDNVVLPRPYQTKIPVEVVPRIDELSKAGFKAPRIAAAMECSTQTILAILNRKGAYEGIPK